MLENHHESINISLFDNVYIPSDAYKHIYDDQINLYRSFWDNHSEDDRILSIIYDHIFRNEPLVEDVSVESLTKDNIDMFFYGES
jgi:hypothetical protein